MKTYAESIIETNENICRNLKVIRGGQGMSFNRLAYRSASMGWELGQKFLANVEAGTQFLSINELVVLAEALGVTVGDLTASVPTTPRVTDTLIIDRLKSSVERAQLALVDAMRDIDQTR